MCELGYAWFRILCWKQGKQPWDRGCPSAAVLFVSLVITWLITTVLLKLRD